MQSHCFLKRNKYSALIYTTNTITTTSSSMATGSNSNGNNCSSGRGAVEQPTMRNLRFGLSSHFQFFSGEAVSCIIFVLGPCASAAGILPPAG